MIKLEGKINKEEAEKQGYIVDTTTYPWVAYKGSRFQPDEWQECYTDLEFKLMQSFLITARNGYALRNVLVQLTNEELIRVRDILNPLLRARMVK